ncbi:urea ABC transporter ATP-binding subunit UrtE [Craurococcus roseus]|uniref:Urea ABC transporter ATP-binding subunit UrtE n=1 Tax=Craurococcus roseus TaxID=77585 RepID=A0ABN1FHX2_9PROT
MALRVEALDLSYGASRCLRGVSLEADPGRITCVLGRNGVGKSSLMRAIVGLERAQSGRIVWEGRDIAAMPPAERARAGIGYVPQGREIFPFLTVQENLETALAAASRGARFVPEEVFALFPVLKQFLRRRGGDLSGGQQQQLAIARALTARPRLLILDEPTEGIQPSVIKDIARVIRHLARDRGLAVVLVEQYFEFARDLADRVAVMVRGEVALRGPVGELEDEAVRRLLTV